MDPVSVFNALYDTKCLKFGRFDLKSGLVAPYYINLRRLPLYPKLMDAVVSQVIERHLTSDALLVTMSQLRKGSRRQAQCCETRADSGVCVDTIDEDAKRLANKLAAGERANEASDSDADADADADSQMEDEDSLSENEDFPRELAREPFEPIICGVPYGALPLATAIAFKAKLPLLFERKHQKSYGDHQPFLEGFVSETTVAAAAAAATKPSSPAARAEKKRVILIEDVICSGASVLESVQNLKNMDLRVEFVICIIDREENGLNLLLEQAGIKVFSLYNMSAILRILEVTGRISRDEYLSARQWMANSQFQTIGVDPTPTSKALADTQAAQRLTSNTAPVEVAIA